MAVIEYDPVQLRQIALAQRAGDATEREYLTSGQLARLHKRAARQIPKWASRTWSALDGQRPQQLPARRERGRRGKAAPLYHAGDIAKVAAWLDGELNKEQPCGDEEPIRAFAARHGMPASTVRKRLKDLCPEITGRTEWREYPRGKRRTTLYPVAAMEAAMRGETWTPPPQPAPAPAEPITRVITAKPDHGEPPVAKAKGGRPRKWDKLRAVIEEFPGLSNEKLAAKYRQRHAAAIFANTLPDADAKRVRITRANLARAKKRRAVKPT